MTREEKKERVKKNSVIQMNEQAPATWQGSLLQVDETYSWGVLAWMSVPSQGAAYIRVDFDDFEYIGEAVMVQREEEG